MDVQYSVSFAPEDLHPALWRAQQLGRARQAVCASEHGVLDAQLPGGGWPVGSLTELLLPHPGLGELRLLAPALAALQRQQRSLMWLDPPSPPCAPALAELGLDVRRLVLVNSRQKLSSRCGSASLRDPHGGRPASAGLGVLSGGARHRLPAADILWALESALKSGHLGAVLAWLPARLPADALRRLELAAQSHGGPAFLLRDAQERQHPSAAPLRLLLAPAGPDRLRVHLLKRRGPPLAEPLTLTLPPVLSAAALARAMRGAAMPPTAASGTGAPAPLRHLLPTSQGTRA